MSGLDESRLRHPAGKAVPESAEVAQARMDEQACRLASSRWDEWHHEVSTGPRRVWMDVVGPFLGALALFLLVFGTAVVGEIAGGWPA